MSYTPSSAVGKTSPVSRPRTTEGFVTAQNYVHTLFTDDARAMQEAAGSRASYARMEAGASGVASSLDKFWLELKIEATYRKFGPFTKDRTQ